MKVKNRTLKTIGCGTRYGTLNTRILSTIEKI